MKYNVLALCMFLCAGLFSQSVNVADYYFHKDTDYKTYQWNPEAIELKEVERTEKRNGRAIQKLTKTLPKGEFSLFTELVYDRDVVRQVAATNPLSGQTEASNRIVLKQPNSKWYYRAAPDELTTLTFSMSSVKTDYGVYNDCIAVKEQFSSDDQNLKAFTKVYYIRYYAKFRGLVAIHMFDAKTNERLKAERAVSEKEYVDNEIESYYTKMAAYENRKVEEAKQKAEQAKIRAEEESKIYNLEQYDKGMYQDVVDELREAITKHFQTASTERDKTNFPDFRSLRRENNKHARYTSSYDLHYKLHPENKPVNELGYTSQYRQDGFQTLLKKKNLTGDANYPLYDKARIRIPHVVKSGVKAKTEVYLNNVQVDFARGITEVKVKKKKVKFKQNLPYIDLQPTLASKMMVEQKGKYLVEYEISNIMGKETVSTELTKKKGKTFKKVAIGSVVVVGAAFYFAGDFILESLGF